MTSALEQVIADDEQGMTHGHDRSLAPPVSGDSLEEGSEVTVFAPGCAPSTLTELLPQPTASLASLPAETLTSAFIVSGADSRPGGQMVSRGELVHVDSNFGNDAPSRGPVETRDLG
jgi:hypothetical protein